MARTNTSDNDSLFGPVIYAYTRKQAIEDGQQIDANEGVLAATTRQHFRMPVYITCGLFGIMERAADNPKAHNDLTGIWHDVCWMARNAIHTARGSKLSGLEFRVLIKGASPRSLHTVRAECGARDIDDAQPCITFMLPEER